MNCLLPLTKFLNVNYFRPILLLNLLFCSACFNPFAPKLDNNIDTSNVITDQQSPEEVLQNFRYAYTFKDSLLYSEVLDESFVFEFFDPDIEPSGGFVTWGRDVDLKTTGRLFREFDVIDLIWLNIIFSERDTINNRVEERQFRRFNLNLSSTEFVFVISGTAIFTFQKSEVDQKWRIIRWKDESDL